MIYEYAVSPHLFVNSANLYLLFHAFEAGSGRFISDYPRDKWFQYVRAFIKQSIKEETEQRSWIELLIKLRNKDALLNGKVHSGIIKKTGLLMQLTNITEDLSGES